MGTTKKTPEPALFGAAGTELWDSIAGKYALRPDEHTRLAAMCRTADTIQMLEETWRELGYPMVSIGSMRQEIIHPLIGELRVQRASLDAALVRLKLPDDDSQAPVVNQQRDAANSKWATGRGRGA